jgi:hypothetical protein
VAEHLRLGGTLKREAAELGVHPVSLQLWTNRLCAASAAEESAGAHFVPVVGRGQVRLTVWFRDVVPEFEGLPSSAWLAELLARC